MNHKLFKSITGIILATAIGAGGYQLGRQSNAIEPQQTFPEQRMQLAEHGSTMVYSCTPETHDVYFDREGDGNYENYQREWYSNSEGKWMRGPEHTLYHPLSISEMRTLACR